MHAEGRCHPQGYGSSQDGSCQRPASCSSAEGQNGSLPQRFGHRWRCCWNDFRLKLRRSGIRSLLVEKSDKLGGNALSIEKTIHGEAVKPFLTDLVSKVEAHPKVQVFSGATFTDLTGHVGHFKGKVVANGSSQDIEFGAAVHCNRCGGIQAQGVFCRRTSGRSHSAYFGRAHNSRRSHAEECQQRGVHPVRRVPL